MFRYGLRAKEISAIYIPRLGKAKQGDGDGDGDGATSGNEGKGSTNHRSCHMAGASKSANPQRVCSITLKNSLQKVGSDSTTIGHCIFVFVFSSFTPAPFSTHSRPMQRSLFSVEKITEKA